MELLGLNPPLKHLRYIYRTPSLLPQWLRPLASFLSNSWFACLPSLREASWGQRQCIPHFYTPQAWFIPQSMCCYLSLPFPGPTGMMTKTAYCSILCQSLPCPNSDCRENQCPFLVTVFPYSPFPPYVPFSPVCLRTVTKTSSPSS